MAKNQTMVPQSKSTTMDAQPSISVDDIAAQIFIKSYMDTAGRTAEHLALNAYEAAEAFASVASQR